MILQIPSEMLNIAPKRIWTDLSEAMAHGHGEVTADSLLEDLRSGDKQLWVDFTDNTCINHTCSWVTAISDYPGKRVCEILYFGGNKMGDMSQLTEVEQWAKDNGCKDMRVIGRKAWVKILAKQDYHEWYTIIGKRL